MLQQQGVSREPEEVLKAWFQEPWRTASPLSPTPLTPPPLRPKPTETSPPTNSPRSRRQHIPSPLETTPTPTSSQHQTQPNPPVHRPRQFDLMWIYTVVFLRSHNQPRSDLSTASPIPHTSLHLRPHLTLSLTMPLPLHSPTTSAITVLKDSMIGLVYILSWLLF